MVTSYAGQPGARVRFEWGPSGAAAISDGLRSCAVVDVLSFTTSVSVAADAGAAVFPCRRPHDARELAARTGSVLAVQRAAARHDPEAVSLSPVTLRRAAPWLTQVVLPSPNGSTVSAGLAEAGVEVLALSLRNRTAGARRLAAQLEHDRHAVVAVVAAGERWDDGSLRPALEDLLGAGAVLAALEDLGHRDALSGDARAAAAAYRRSAPELELVLRDCASGRELIERGDGQDVELALGVDASRVVPVLLDGAFRPTRAGAVLRPATGADAEAIAQVWLRSFAAALPTVTRAHHDDEVRGYVAETLVPRGQTWVAEDGRGVRAMLALSAADRPDAGPAWVDQLYVAPDAQGRGLGTALLELAMRRRPEGLQLWTFQVNLPAQHFYDRHGFVAVERTDGSGNEEHEPDIRYLWRP